MSAAAATLDAPLQRLLATRAGSLYALYDAARDKSLLAYLGQRGIAHDCLYAGVKAITLKDVAPYLVSCRDFGAQPARFIDDIWRRGVSMLVESDGPVDALRQQLKKNAFVKNADGAACYFRYYDARAYSRFMRVASNEQLGQLFGTAIRAIYWVDTSSGELTALRRKPSGMLGRLFDPAGAQFDLHSL